MEIRFKLFESFDHHPGPRLRRALSLTLGAPSPATIISTPPSFRPLQLPATYRNHHLDHHQKQLMLIEVAMHLQHPAPCSRSSGSSRRLSIEALLTAALSFTTLRLARYIRLTVTYSSTQTMVVEKSRVTADCSSRLLSILVVLLRILNRVLPSSSSWQRGTLRAMKLESVDVQPPPCGPFGVL